ncbi:MAG: hypothetical protein R3A44_25920 [Caldilineaceae bacterium]
MLLLTQNHRLFFTSIDLTLSIENTFIGCYNMFTMAFTQEDKDWMLKNLVTQDNLDDSIEGVKMEFKKTIKEQNELITRGFQDMGRLIERAYPSLEQFNALKEELEELKENLVKAGVLSADVV